MYSIKFLECVTDMTRHAQNSSVIVTICYTCILGGHYSGNKISHNLWLWLKGHTFMSLIPTREIF